MKGIDDRSYGTLCICAIRYCFGRQTYMPTLVQNIVLKNICKLSDHDLDVIISDLHSMTKWDYGDPVIDKPGWIEFEKRITTEREKRDHENQIFHQD